MHHGARDLERMVQTLATLARACRRELSLGRAPLRLILGGHVVVSDAKDLETRLVMVDPLVVREVVDACCGEDPANIHVALTGTHAVLLLPLPAALTATPEAARDRPRGAPLLALIEGLQGYAGSAVEALAAAQIILERQGAAIALGDDGVCLWLPCAEAGTA